MLVHRPFLLRMMAEGSVVIIKNGNRTAIPLGETNSLSKRSWIVLKSVVVPEGNEPRFSQIQLDIDAKNLSLDRKTIRKI